MLLDSKQVNSKGITLNSSAAGGQMQMSDDWIKAVLLRLDANSPAALAIKNAQNNQILMKAVVFVDKDTKTWNLVRVNP